MGCVDVGDAGLPHTDLARGRAAARSLDWEAAHTALSLADRAVTLDGDDLELLATAAYLLGRVEECLEALRRAYQRYVDSGSPRRAVRSAFWLLFHLNNQGDFAQATGWLARANRLLEDAPEQCAEHGYMLVPIAFHSIVSGDFGNTRTLAERATQIGRRFDEPDLVALALTLQGRALIYEADPARGLPLLDEAMLCVVTGETSPPVAGTVYCSVIDACREIHELPRAHEWTQALSAWCGRHSGMVTFTGQCLVHRAEVMRLHGAWPAAIEEARRASERFAHAADHYYAATAFYEQAEVLRERGDFSAAEQAYQAARQAGLEPHPGLALLRLAQGNVDAARVAIQRVLAETAAKPRRTRLLPACVEIM
jgi:tetratricopeptide (TPR) repeat protein